MNKLKGKTNYVGKLKGVKSYVGAALTGTALVAGTASAQGSSIDVSSITAVVTEVATAAATLGLAILGMHYGIKAYKWLKGAG